MHAYIETHTLGPKIDTPDPTHTEKHTYIHIYMYTYIGTQSLDLKIDTRKLKP